jgi:hypothetical protein
MSLNSMNHALGLPVKIGPMIEAEAEALSILFRRIVDSLPYYNDVAKRAEIAKYSSELLRESVAKNPNSVLVARDGHELVGFCFNE